MKMLKLPLETKNPDRYCGPGSGAGNQSRTDDLVITNDVLYQLSYTSIPADLHSIPHNDVFVKWFYKNILRSSKQVLMQKFSSSLTDAAYVPRC